MNGNPTNQPNTDTQKTIDQACWKRIETASLSIDTYRIEGVCPVCKHSTSQDQPVGMVFGIRDIEKKRLSKIIGPVNVYCACNREAVPVPDSDTDKKGCGWHGTIPFHICEV